MSIEFQDNVIYFIVGITILSLIFPTIKTALNFLVSINTPKNAKTNFSAYADVCEKCSVKK